MADKPGLFDELKRRRVLSAAGVYAAVAFLVAQVAELVLPGLLLPEWTFRLIIVLLLLGFPMALVLAWFFDLTPHGPQRTGAPDETSGGAGAAAADNPRAVAGTARLRPFRGAGYVGVGMVIALVAFGGYHYMGQPSESENGDTGTESARHSIAVLPFTNMAGGEENEYFADGITEDILTNLGLVPDFTVISRTSVMRYKGSDQSIPEIARELGVRYVLEGSVRRSGDRVRVVVQLIEPGTDTQVWAQTLDRRLDDIFALQSEVAQSVVDALRVELAGGVSERIGRAPTADIAAYELFLAGRDFYYQYERASIERAIELFRGAIDRDPDFALAHAWLGSAYAVYVFNYRGPSELMKAALESSRHATELQPDLGDAYRALGTALSITSQFDRAIVALERAVELNPNDFAAMGNLGLTYALRGEWDRAIDLTRRSIARDPVRSYLAYGNLASYYLYLGMEEPAIEAANRALTLRLDEYTAATTLARIELGRGRTAQAVARMDQMVDEKADPGRLALFGQILIMAGEEERARAMLERAHEAAPDALPVQEQAPAVLLAYLLGRAGDTDRADALLESAARHTRDVMDGGHASPAMSYSLASIAALQSRPDAALDHLEQAVVLGWNDPALTAHDPLLASVRDEPRFRAAMDRIRARNDAMRQRVENSAGSLVP